PYGSRRSPRGHLLDLRLQPLLRFLELARDLCVQISPRIDGGDARRTRADGALDRRARIARARLQSPQLGDAGFERLALARERRHGAAVFFDAVAIDPSERRRRAVRASQLPQIVDVEQQPPVARAAHLVQLHEARFDVGTLPIRLPLQRLRARGRRVELTLNAAGLRLDRGELFRFDLSIQFELAELNEQRLLLRSERFRLALERRET